MSSQVARTAQIKPAQAIVVLGGGIDVEGRLSNPSLRRTVEGILLYSDGLAPLLVFLGPGGEAGARVAFARQLGVPPLAALAAPEAWTTREEAERVEQLLRPRGIRTILLVTDSHHMRRAQPVFERAGFVTFAAPADEFSSAIASPEGRLHLMRQNLRELVGWLYYRFTG